MYCKYCGAVLDDDSVFCVSCGQHVTIQTAISTDESEKCQAEKNPMETEPEKQTIEPPEDGKEWFYRNIAGEIGPFSKEEIADRIKSGFINDKCYLKKSSEENWMSLGEYREKVLMKKPHVPVVEPTGDNRTLGNKESDTKRDKSRKHMCLITTRFSIPKSILTAVLTLVASFVLLVVIGNHFIGIDYVRRIKNSYMSDYPGITVSEAFGQFYSSPEWNYESNDGEKYVVFTGKYEGKNRTFEIRLRYKPDTEEDGFRLVSGTVDDAEMPDLALLYYHEAPFWTYSK